MDLLNDINAIQEQKNNISLELQNVVLNHAPAFVAAVSEADHISDLASSLKSGMSCLYSAVSQLESSVPKFKESCYPPIAPHTSPSDSPLAAHLNNTLTMGPSRSLTSRFPESLSPPDILFFSEKINVLMVEERFPEAVDALLSTEKELTNLYHKSSDVRGFFAVHCALSAAKQVRSDFIPLLTDSLKRFCESEVSTILSLRIEDSDQSALSSPMRLFSTARIKPSDSNQLPITSLTPSKHQIINLLSRLGHLSTARETLLSTCERSARILLTNSRLSSSFNFPSSITSLIPADFDLVPSLYWTVLKVSRLFQFSTHESLSLARAHKVDDSRVDKLMVSSWLSMTLKKFLLDLIPSDQTCILKLLGCYFSFVFAAFEVSNKRTSTSMNILPLVVSFIKEPLIFNGVGNWLKGLNFSYIIDFHDLTNVFVTLNSANIHPFSLMKQKVYLLDHLLNFFRVIDILAHIFLQVSKIANFTLSRLIYNTIIDFLKSFLDNLSSLFPKSTGSTEQFQNTLTLFTSCIWGAFTLPSMIDYVFFDCEDSIKFEPSLIDCFCSEEAAQTTFDIQHVFNEQRVSKPSKIHSSLYQSTNSLIETLVLRSTFEHYNFGLKLIDFCQPVTQFDSSLVVPSPCAKSVVCDFRYALDRIPPFHLISLFVLKKAIYLVFRKFGGDSFYNNLANASMVAVCQFIVDLYYLKSAFWSILPSNFEISFLNSKYLPLVESFEFLSDQHWIDSRISSTLETFNFPDLSEITIIQDD
ncbi:hypothetical protein P9112_004067 [Eukaryota sp. TZLM1-RC]